MASPEAPAESIPELGRAVIDDVRRLAQLEVRLALEEVKRTVLSALLDIAFFLAAGLFVLYGVAYALLALPWRLDLLTHWWGWVVAGGASFLTALALIVVGALRLRATFRQARSAIDEMKGEAEWLKQLPGRATSSS